MYETTAYTAQPSAEINPIVWILYIGVIALMVASLWKMFTKAGKPGWAAIVPFYNTIVNLEIVGRPIWWIVLFFIPIVGFVAAIMLAIDTARAFGKGGGFAILLIFLPFIGYPMLAWGDATYVGPVAAGGAPASTPAAAATPVAPAATDAQAAPSSDNPFVQR